MEMADAKVLATKNFASPKWHCAQCSPASDDSESRSPALLTKASRSPQCEFASETRDSCEWPLSGRCARAARPDAKLCIDRQRMSAITRWRNMVVRLTQCRKARRARSKRVLATPCQPSQPSPVAREGSDRDTFNTVHQLRNRARACRTPCHDHGIAHGLARAYIQTVNGAGDSLQYDTTETTLAVAIAAVSGPSLRRN
jgi:hypothetical protein